MSVQATYADGEEVCEDGTVIRKRKNGITRFKFTVEPIKICMGFATKFTNGVTIDVLERNVCHLKYNLTEDQCYENMTPDVKTLVEGMTADVNMINQIIQGIIPVILILFVGPWSDTNGRKPFILLPIFGFAVYFLSWAVLSYFPSIPIIYYFIPSIPLGLGGMLASLFVCTWSYTCDNFDPEERPLRFSMSSASLTIGIMIGNSLSGQVMRWTKPYGFQVIFVMSFIATVIAFFYTLFFLKETRVRPPGVPRSNLINFDNVKSTFEELLIRPKKGVLLSVLVTLIILCEIPLNAGDDGILYLVGKTQFSWDLREYNLIVIMSSIVSGLAPVLCIWLMIQTLGWSNNTLLVLCLSIFVIGETLKALSVNEIMFWIVAVAAKLGSAIGPAIDTELSEIASENNAGKAFTLSSICDALTPVLSIPLYTVIYKLFLPNNTLYVFFTSAILALIALISSVAIHFRKSSISYTRMNNPVEDTNEP